MWKKKKFVVIGVIVGVALLAGVAGVALAQTNNNASGATQPKSFAARVAAILGIDQQKVEDAFIQARRQMADEAVDARLKALVDSGKITQQQADQYKSWWESRPDGVLPGIGPGVKPGARGFGGMRWCLPPTTQTPSD